MRVLFPLLTAALLTSCGVDGPPVPPSQVEEDEARRGDITLGGSASLGVTNAR